MTKLLKHPFREGITRIIEKHFAPEIAKHFVLEFEANMYSHDAKNIWAQLRDDKLIIEVRYEVAPDLFEYLCDLYGWESYQQTEHKLLRAVTDKVKVGKFGGNWTFRDGRISEEFSSGRHETKQKVKIKNKVV